MLIEQYNYLDKDGISRMSSVDNNVKEATAALKGLLGIGDSSPLVASTESHTPAKPKKKTKKKVPPANNPKTPNNKNDNASSGKKNKKKQENFAWSAFQSSPDASKLPLPAFSPTEPKALTNKLPPTAPPTCGIGTTTSAPAPVTPTPISTASFPSPSPSALPQPPKPHDEPVTSATGINLAAKIKSPKSTSVPPPLLNPPPIPHYYPPPPPPPGCIIIQVQVPPLLPPDRLILVPTPAGYPVQVQVPLGLPPGAVIPVQVPTMPMHMMPPMYPPAR